MLDDRIWVTGGMTGDRGNKLATTEIYDPSTDSWEQGVPMLTGRSSLAAAEVDGTIYAIGGSTLENPYLDIVEAYDPEAGAWERLAPLATPRYEHAAVALDGLIYVIGGQTDERPDRGGRDLRPGDRAVEPRAAVDHRSGQPASGGVGGQDLGRRREHARRSERRVGGLRPGHRRVERRSRDADHHVQLRSRGL